MSEGGTWAVAGEAKGSARNKMPAGAREWRRRAGRDGQPLGWLVNGEGENGFNGTASGS